MKKYDVRLWFSTFADFVVYADNEKEATEKARNLCYGMSFEGQLADNRGENEEPDVYERK